MLERSQVYGLYMHRGTGRQGVRIVVACFIEFVWVEVPLRLQQQVSRKQVYSTTSWHEKANPPGLVIWPSRHIDFNVKSTCVCKVKIEFDTNHEQCNGLSWYKFFFFSMWWQVRPSLQEDIWIANWALWDPSGPITVHNPKTVQFHKKDDPTGIKTSSPSSVVQKEMENCYGWTSVRHFACLLNSYMSTSKFESKGLWISRHRNNCQWQFGSYLQSMVSLQQCGIAALKLPSWHQGMECSQEKKGGNQ